MSLDESSISYELRLQFETSVTQAIQNSLTLSRPLCIYLVNEEEEEEVTNEEDIANWELSHLPNKLQGSNENKCDLSMDSQNFLISKTINLKLVKNSNDFNLFLQAFPQFPMQFPCLYFIYGGVVLDCLLPHVEIEEFETRVQDVIKKVNTIEQQQQSNVSNTSTPQQTLPNTPTPQQVSQESTPIPTQRSSNDSSRQTISETPKPKPKPYKSLKEESAEYAAQKYRENLAKQNQKAKEEKQRILRLLKADEAERRSRAKLEREENRKEMNNVEEEGGKGEGEGEQKEEEGINKKSKLTKIEEIHENLHNSKIDNSIEYLIQIKLFDGTSLKCKILHEKTLKDVREYINSIHKEYSNFNYSFYKPVDRMTYTLEMEDLKLIELHLNRATLILKPIDLDTNNQLLKNGSISNISYDKETGGFGWFKNKIGGLFGWGYNNNNNHINNNNHTDNNNNNNGTIKLDENDDQIKNEDHNKSNEEDIELKDENNRSKSPRIIDSSEYEYEYYTPRGGPSSLISRNSSPINPISSNNNNSNGMGMNFSSNNLNIPLSSEEINNGDSNPILSHVSSFTDLHHPRPHLVGNSSSNSNRVLKTPPGLGSSSTTRIRTMVDDWSGEEVINTTNNNNEIEFKTKKKDERKVYNGNFTNLEDDNKKKDEFSKQNEDKE